MGHKLIHNVSFVFQLVGLITWGHWLGSSSCIVDYTFLLIVFLYLLLIDISLMHPDTRFSDIGGYDTLLKVM